MLQISFAPPRPNPKKIAVIFQVSGDVVVGWVNARTGKGEIDDYFLAGNQLKCDDGAESCPDISKPVNPNKSSIGLVPATAARRVR